eukprot:scaffold21.g2162.t1
MSTQAKGRSSRPQRGQAKYGEGFHANGSLSYGQEEQYVTELPAARVDLNKMKVGAMRKYAKQYEVAGVNPQTSSKEDLASAVSKHWNAWAITEESVLQNLLRSAVATHAADAAAAVASAAALAGGEGGEGEGGEGGEHISVPLAEISLDELKDELHDAIEVEQLHEVFEQEMRDAKQQVQEAVETALSESEMKMSLTVHHLNTFVGLCGVISFWRGMWGLLDYYFEDSLEGYVICLGVGLLVMLVFQLFKLPVAEGTGLGF